MSFATTIDIKDAATPELRALVERCSPRRLNAAVGPRVARLVQRHLRAKGTNKRGWPTTNFYGRAAAATGWVPAPDGSLIFITQIGIRQRLLGGKIRPVNAKALAIPMDPLSYGKVPSDFPGLFLIKAKTGKAFLAIKDGGTVKFLFELSGGVNQAPDPTVLPTREQIAEEAKLGVLAATKPKGGQST